MRALLLFLAISMLGCFRTIDTDDGPFAPARPIFDSGPRPDTSPFVRDSGPTARDSAPFVFDGGFSDSGVVDTAVVDASPCFECTVDSDCPEPPPVGCGRAVCVAGSCAVGIGECGEERCDPEALVCEPNFAEISVTVRTDYEPFVEFDRAVLSVGGRVAAQDAELVGDPIEGFVFDPLRVAPSEEAVVEVTLYLGCEALTSRRALAVVDDSSTSITISVTRTIGP